MLHYCECDILFSEIPDEICLGFTIYGCVEYCRGCHSPHLWASSNTKTQDLTLNLISDKYEKSRDLVTCILLLGEGNDIAETEYVFKAIKDNFNVKTALFSGKTLDNFPSDFFKCIDYIKVNPYQKDRGGLLNPYTNQRLYTVVDGRIDKDITYKYWEDYPGVKNDIK